MEAAEEFPRVPGEVLAAQDRQVFMFSLPSTAMESVPISRQARVSLLLDLRALRWERLALQSATQTSSWGPRTVCNQNQL